MIGNHVCGHRVKGVNSTSPSSSLTPEVPGRSPTLRALCCNTSRRRPEWAGGTRARCVDLAIYLAGWTLIGWLLLWRPRPHSRSRRYPSLDLLRARAIAVDHPGARRGKLRFPHLMSSVGAAAASGPAGRSDGGRRPLNDDGTGDVAASHGATVVVHTRRCRPGWLGKPHACAIGAAEASALPLTCFFVDADVRPAPDLSIGSAPSSAGRHILTRRGDLGPAVARDRRVGPSRPACCAT